MDTGVRFPLRLLALALAAGMAAGCANTVSHRFSGQQMPIPGGPPGELTVNGFSDWSMEEGDRLFLNFTYRGYKRMRFSYIDDTYAAGTTDGRTVVLGKNFLTYPDNVDPGETADVSLLLPDDLKPDNITHIVATLDNKQRVVQIQPTHRNLPPRSAPRISAPVLPAAPPAPAYAQPKKPKTLGGKISEKIDAAYGRFEEKISTPPDREPPPKLIAAPALVPMDPALANAVPVTVAFLQEHGGMLRAVVSWNGGDSVLRMAPGESETFHLEPGRHELAFECIQAPMPSTIGRLPVTVHSGAPLRIELKARARYNGASVKAHLWHREQLVLEKDFSPGGRL